jgi:hypothetical protein
MSLMTMLKRAPRLSIILGIVVLLLAVFAFWNIQSSALHPELDAIRKQGYPATLAEMNEWYEWPPDFDNAALYYTNALAKIGGATNQLHKLASDDSLLPTRGKLFTEEERIALISDLASNRALIAPFYATNIPTRSRYPIDYVLGFNMLLPHLQQVRAGTRMLAVLGMLHFQNNDPDQGIESFVAAGRLTRTLQNEPVFISQLVECANWAIICKKLEWSLNLKQLSSEQLKILQDMIKSAETNSFYRGLVSEQAAGLDLFDNPRSQKALGNFTLANGSGSPTEDRLKCEALVGLLKTSGLFTRDKRFYLHTISNAIAVARLPLPERYTASQAINFAPPNRFYVVSGLLLPALGKCYARDATRAANMRITKTALGIERFRAANSNSLPATLTELVPAYLDGVPDDPFDGKSLRYKRLTLGYVVYSVGSDLQDNGGKEYDKKNASVQSDVTFIVER